MNDVVGHKTFYENGQFRHEPLYADEARELIARADAEKKRREEQMPDEQSAIRAMFDAWLRLKDFGWREAIYCPKDGSLFDVIEPGSTGIHACSYVGEWPDGAFWIHADGDMSPSHPVLFREKARAARLQAIGEADARAEGCDGGTRILGCGWWSFGG